MKTVQFHEFGSPSVLQYNEVDQPAYSDDQVLIKVHAAGVNRIDCKIRDGSSFVAKTLKDKLPSSLGYEFSGRNSCCRRQY